MWLLFDRGVRLEQSRDPILPVCNKDTLCFQGWNTGANGTELILQPDVRIELGHYFRCLFKYKDAHAHSLFPVQDRAIRSKVATDLNPQE